MVQGLGIRATARVFEVDPNTVLHWLVEAAEQLRAFSETIASLPGFGMVPEGHLFYSSGPNMRTRRIKPCSVRVRIDPIPAKA